MGRNISTNMDAVDQPISLTAQGAIAAGDLVKVDAGGGILKVNESYPVAAQNSALGVSAAVATNSLGSYGFGGINYAQAVRNIQPLPDGGFALAYSGNGVAVSTGASVAFYGPNSVARQAVVLSGGASTREVRVVRAGADNVFVAWTETTNLLVAIVNYTTGAVVQSAAVTGVTAADGLAWNLATLANGEVVLAYHSSGDMVFKRFNASGALQGVVTTVEVTQTPLGITVLPLAAGGFIIRWGKTTSTAGNRMARYNAAGVLQGAVVGISSGAGAYDGAGTAYLTGPYEGKLIELTNGNIVSVDVSSAATQGFKVYDSTLSLLNTVSLGAVTAQYQDLIQLAPRFGGGFWLQAIGTAPGYYVREYNNAGQLLRQSTMGFSGPCKIMDRPGNGPALLLMGHNPSAPSSNLQAFALLPSLVPESTTGYIILNAASTELGQWWGELLTTGLLQAAWAPYPSGGMALHTALPGAASVMGVAQSAATAVGQSVRVATAGKFAMNQVLASPSFDRRASIPPGTKGMTIGNVAILNGING